MITINLLPKNLRKIERKVVLPYKTALVWVIACFLFLHAVLLLIAGVKQVQVLTLKLSWGMVEPQSKDSLSTKSEIKKLETDIKSMTAVLSRKVSATELFSGLNAAVPKGLWLERFSFSDEGLVVQGSVISLTQNEMTTIGKFLQDLKSNKTFQSLFSKIELNSVQRRTIKTYDVVDFVVVGDLKK
jgi:hypothetical protein